MSDDLDAVRQRVYTEVSRLIDEVKELRADEERTDLLVRAAWEIAHDEERDRCIAIVEGGDWSTLTELLHLLRRDES